MRTIVDAVERRVRLAVPAAVEAVPAGGHAGRRRDRAGAAQLGERGFGADPFGVVAEDDEHLGGGVGADPEPVTQRGRRVGGELVEVTVVVVDLVVEGQPAPGEGPQGVLRRRRRRVERPGPEPGAAIDERLVGQAGQRLAQLGGCVDDDLLELMIAEVRALTAVSRAIFSWRIISTAPSAVFGTAVDWPASTERAASSASRVSDLPFARRARRSPRLTSTTR